MNKYGIISFLILFGLIVMYGIAKVVSWLIYLL